MTLSFDAGCGCPCVRVDDTVSGLLDPLTATGLSDEESLPSCAVDRTAELGDDGFAVLGHHERVAFGELADFGAGQDGYVLGCGVPSGHRPGLPGVAADPDGAEHVGDLLVEGHVLGAAEHAEHVGQPEQGAGLLLAEDRCQLSPRLCRIHKREPQGSFVRHPGAKRR